MNCRTDNREIGLTLRELLVTITSVLILLVLIISATTSCSRKTSRIHCMMGLKQIAQGFGLWANENDARFPMEVSVSSGGSRDHALTGQLLPNLLVAAKQLGDPRLLICPSDSQRQPATNFAALTTTNISFFLNVSAAYTNQSHVIVGDRDITTNGSSVRPGPLEIREPLVVGWGKVLHSGGGNIALVDGSGHQINTHQFQARLATSITNRLIIP